MDIGQLNYNGTISIDSRLPLVLKDLSKCILEDNPPLEYIFRYCAKLVLNSFECDEDV